MKQIKLTFLLIVIMSMVGAKSFAHDFAVANDDGVTIYYVWTNNKTEVAVSYQGSNYSSYDNEYTGNVVISESVVYNGKTYSVTSIGNSTFRGCSGLTSIEIPNSVTSIGYGAFSDCTGLTSVTIPNSVTSIGDRAFYNTAWYNNQPDGLIYLGKVAYKYKGTMPDNTSITIKEGTLEIADFAFGECTGLTSIEIPNSVTSIGNSAFDGCSRLTSVYITDLVAWCNIDFALTYDDGDIEVPSNPLSYAQHLFLNGIEINNLTIPNSVTNIGGGAFYCYSGLTSVNIPNSVTTIGAAAFAGCSCLTSVNIPNSVTSIGKQAFEGCRDLAVHITDLSAWCNINFSIYTSHHYLYSGSNPLSGGGHLFISGTEISKELVIPNSVTTIKEGCFYGYKSLISITIPESVTSIREYAFSNSGLTSITIPNSVTSIGSEVFYGCKNLAFVTFGNGVTSIDAYTFGGCEHLKGITFGTGLKNISPAAFEHHYGQSYLPYKMIWLSETPPNGYEKLQIRAPGGNKINFVPNDSYTNLYEYRTMVFPFLNQLFEANGVIYVPTSMSEYTCDAFSCVYNESLKTISIGKTVSYNGTIMTVASISDYAFDGCNNLTSVTVNIETPLPISSSTFSNRANATLYVPYGCKATYEVADYWKDFEEIVEMPDRCATPTISFKGGKLHFECETPDVTYHYTITPPSKTNNTGNDVEVGSSYTVQVYAGKDGYLNSDITTQDINIRGIKGDVDGDGVVDVNDVQTTINIILKK